MILTAVFLLSLSALSFEVLLIRVFSISQWNHLSFMVISIALFGFAASGTFLNISEIRKTGWSKQLSSNEFIKTFIIFYSFTGITSFIVLNRMPLDYFKLPLEPIQILYLLTAYLLLSLPFFFTGLVISIAYAFIPEKTGFIYFASMAGSAIGAILPVPLLPLFGEGKLIILSTLIPLLLVFFRLPQPNEKNLSAKNIYSRRHSVLKISSLGVLFMAGMLISTNSNSIVKVKPSQYKALSQILQFPDTRITESVTSIRGRFDSIHSPHVRFAPGLSLKFTDALSYQQVTFKDGDNPFYFYNIHSQKDAQFSKFTLSYAGYILSPDPEHILLIQQGGGTSIPCAIASGARKITIVEQQPHIARTIQRHYNIPVVNQNPRTYLTRSDQRFNIIHVENWGSSLPGSAALTQEYSFTTESFSAYFNHLSENGILIISRKLLLPPATSIRLWAGAYESMRSLGIENPERHIAVLRNWNTFTFIVSARPLEDTTSIRKFASDLNFDLVYLPGITEDMANRFNTFNVPYHFLEIKRLAEAYRFENVKAYHTTNLLDVAPQADSRPFPERFLKWSKLKSLYKTTGSRFYSLFMSGEIVVAVVFFEALLIASLLLALPLIVILKESQKLHYSRILYFLAIGAGFMFVELFFIKKYIFVFGDPVISFTIVLTGILVFSGFGGYLSHQIGRQGIRYALIALIAVLFLIFLGIDPIINRILGLSKPLRYFLTILILMPSGFLLGLPFPLGMRYLLNNPSQRAYAWSANGCASVLASIASAQIALSIGVPAIITFAAFAYLIAFISTLVR